MIISKRKWNLTEQTQDLPPSKIGLIQMTRQRVRSEMEIKTIEPNPNQNGTVEAPIVLIDKIYGKLEKILSSKIQ